MARKERSALARTAPREGLPVSKVQNTLNRFLPAHYSQPPKPSEASTESVERTWSESDE